ncbi:MAG: GFA family protein [Rhodanobacteraceae bacterium]|nr:GFA family protein [Rhodanobacteraceae bacterium]MBK7043697.1 GFA family protein [Rhodanobacteraceae bacterium]MBP9154823.1 GFA family protein [Xanthomonadales bacterium]HQW80783.1 GFA family protein [Pseudomonadota bacterium]
MSSPATAQGGCLCGKTRFAFALPTIWVAHCHCTMCRRAHGAAFVTWVGVEAARFRWTAQEQLHWYASSSGAERGFCACCGSPIVFRSERWPGEIHLARALIEGELDRAPQLHVFHDYHVPWVSLGDDLPRKGNLSI